MMELNVDEEFNIRLFVLLFGIDNAYRLLSVLMVFPRWYKGPNLTKKKKTGDESEENRMIRALESVPGIRFILWVLMEKFGFSTCLPSSRAFKEHTNLCGTPILDGPMFERRLGNLCTVIGNVKNRYDDYILHKFDQFNIPKDCIQYKGESNKYWNDVYKYLEDGAVGMEIDIVNAFLQICLILIDVVVPISETPWKFVLKNVIKLNCPRHVFKMMEFCKLFRELVTTKPLEDYRCVIYGKMQESIEQLVNEQKETVVARANDSFVTKYTEDDMERIKCIAKKKGLQIRINVFRIYNTRKGFILEHPDTGEISTRCVPHTDIQRVIETFLNQRSNRA
jgi:hypothetical protein